MKINPVYKRETTVSSRSFRMALTVLIFNGILAIVALLDMYSVVARVKLTAEIRYASFLDLYVFVATTEFIMLLFIIPGLTSGSISGERERQTMELMLTTQMTPAEIVLGKLFAGFSTVALLVISSFPVLSLVFVYGGVTVMDVGMLLLCYITTALLAGSLGILFSSMFRLSSIATVVSYGIIAGVTIGTLVINQFAFSFMELNGDSYLQNIVNSGRQTNSGGLFYLLLLNPAVTFYVTIKGQTEKGQVVARMIQWFGNRQDNFITQNWVLCSLVVQLALAGICLWIAIRKVNPRKNKSCLL